MLGNEIDRLTAVNRNLEGSVEDLRLKLADFASL